MAGTYGDSVNKWALDTLGRVVGPWQSYATRQILRYSESEDLICRIALISTGRQNGKTVIVQDFAGWMLDYGRKLSPFSGWTEMLAAAHDAPQARKMYDRVRYDIESHRDLSARIRTTKQIGISAGPLNFDTVTGQPGSVRGSSAGAIAWDEMLTQRDWEMWEALSPAQSAQRSPLMLLTSTAGKGESVVLRTFYDRLVRIASGDEKPDPTFYGAWWQSDHLEVGYDANGEKRPLTREDWVQIGKANPGLGDGQLTRQAILHDYNTLPYSSWIRERLNHFQEDGEVADDALPPGAWAAIRTPDPLADIKGPFVLGVDIQPGWDRATITVSGMREDGRVGTEVYRDLRRGEGGVTSERIIAEVKAFPDIDEVLEIAFENISPGAPAFRRDAEETGLPWAELKPAEVVAACMDVTERILGGTLAVDDPLLDTQIALVKRRDVGQDGAFRFSREHSKGPIDGIMALTFSTHKVAEYGSGSLVG